jgi:5-methylcytosine-specific restriction endonuclease McrA
MKMSGERINRLVIFERDGWRCQLCGKRTDRTKVHPHPDAPVLDHIVPLSVGGPHEPSNVQCAHSRCNGLKGARAANDQLRLIG